MRVNVKGWLIQLNYSIFAYFDQSVQESNQSSTFY